jgi:hypothetical protein
MSEVINDFFALRLEKTRTALEKNLFTAFTAQDREAARALVLEQILAPMGKIRVGLGGSVTLVQTGVYEGLKKMESVELLDSFDKALSNEEKTELRQQSLAVDVFFTGSNAVTEDGVLINLDMVGNRVGAMTFGPRNVVVLVGRNKLVPDLQAGMDRIKDYAACVNTMRLDKKTPCAKTGVCHDCSSEDRICNTWTIHEKCFPKGRIIVILVNEDLGF